MIKAGNLNEDQSTMLIPKSKKKTHCCVSVKDKNNFSKAAERFFYYACDNFALAYHVLIITISRILEIGWPLRLHKNV